MRLVALSRACEVFSLVAKVIWIALVLLRSVIGLPNSRHYLSQLNARLSQPQLVHSCFPALQAGFLCLLWVLLRWHQLFFLMGSCNYFGFGFRNGEWCNIQTPRRKWKIFDLVSTFFVTFKVMIKCDIRLTILLFSYFRYLLFYHKKVLEYEWLRRSLKKVRSKSQIK